MQDKQFELHLKYTCECGCKLKFPVENIEVKLDCDCGKSYSLQFGMFRLKDWK
jgi:hypothetical protein